VSARFGRAALCEPHATAYAGPHLAPSGRRPPETLMPIRFPSAPQALAALALSTAALAHAQDGSTPKGVNPKDNLSKLELIYKGDALDGSQRIDSFTVKYDRALTPLLGANVELPIVRYSGPFLTESGVGDMNFRVRYNVQRGAVTFIPGLEIVAPTASQDVLGLGKWQLNPVLGAVMPLSQTAFVFAGYKHLYSIGGDDARRDINASQPRVLVARLSPQGWWLLADAKYTHDWGTKIDAFDIELEAGGMLSPNTGISARIGTSALDGARNTTIGLNLRFIF